MTKIPPPIKIPDSSYSITPPNTPATPPVPKGDHFERVFTFEGAQQRNLQEMAQSVDVRWQLFALAQRNEGEIATAYASHAEQLKELVKKFVGLSQEDLETFSTE